MIVKLILIAVVPITGLITINQNRMLRSYLKLANGINKKLKENKSKDEQLVHFKSDYTKDSLSIKVSLLLFIRAANNYIEIFWREGDLIKNQMVRTSLKKAEEVLHEYKFVFKCHRSFMVNINYIDKIEGSIQGYKLFFDKVDFSIPVSKNFAYKLQDII
jgi:DNA-binding LytR/AlgR family response regulator